MGAWIKGGQTEKVGDSGKDVKGGMSKIVMDGIVSMLEDTVEFWTFCFELQNRFLFSQLKIIKPQSKRRESGSPSNQIRNPQKCSRH